MSSITYENLENEDIKVKPVLAFHFREFLCGIKRRIQKKPNITNPWMVKSCTKIHATVYLKWFRVVRDFKIKTLRTIDLKKNKKGEVTQITLKFFHIGPICYHLGKAVNDCNKESFTNNFLKKHWSDGSTGSIVVNDENPATMNFCIKSGKLTFLAHYEIKNRYGNVCL